MDDKELEQKGEEDLEEEEENIEEEWRREYERRVMAELEDDMRRYRKWDRMR